MPDVDVTRNFYTTSSCGVCGKASLDAVRLISRHCPGDDPSTVAAETLSAMPEKLRAAQKVFASTGGLHGAALFGADGSTLAVREDIGRHNAVDKVIGWALEADRIPLTGTVLLVSGRASFELTQKAVMAGIPVLAAVSAPSSLAVDLASQSGLTLVAFLRGDSMNVYTRPDRVTRARDVGHEIRALISPDAYQSSAAARRYFASDGGLPRGRRCVVSARTGESGSRPGQTLPGAKQPPRAVHGRGRGSRYFLDQVRPDSWRNVKVRLSP